MRRISQHECVSDLASECEVNEGMMDKAKKAALAAMIAGSSMLPNAANAGGSSADDGRKNDVGDRNNGHAIVRPKDLGKNLGGQKNDAPQYYNGLSRDNLKNLIANIAYNETMTDYVKYGNDDDIIYAFLNMVNNRAGGKPENIASELSRKGQFSSFPKHVPNGVVKDKGFEPWDPSKEGGKGKACERLWNRYNDAAEMLLNGKVPDVIGNRNMLANKRIDSASSYNSWGKKCDKRIGSQFYGYQKDQDGFRKYAKSAAAAKNRASAPKQHVVRKGDTLSSIAGRYGTTAVEIARKNGIGVNSILRINQRLSI